MIASQEVPSALEPKFAPSDLVQETILKGFQNFQSFRGTSAAELARWLRQILRNHLANVQKAFGRERRDLAREQQIGIAALKPDFNSPSAVALTREQQERLSAAIGRLSDVHRCVIMLRHCDQLTFEEIGKRLKRTDEAVRKVWARGIRQLQRELGNDGTV